jgi:hypothetical protein
MKYLWKKLLREKSHTRSRLEGTAGDLRQIEQGEPLSDEDRAALERVIAEALDVLPDTRGMKIMETLESLRRRIQSAQDLYGIIRTMKALAAASIRQFEQAVEAVDVYTRTVDTGLRIVLQDQSTQMENMLKNKTAERWRSSSAQTRACAVNSTRTLSRLR